MLPKTLNNFILFACVRHEVIKDDMRIDESLDVKLFPEDLSYEPVFLICFEALVLLAARFLKGQGLVLILHLDQQTQLFSLLVQNLVMEEDEDNDTILRCSCNPKDLMFYLVD